MSVNIKSENRLIKIAGKTDQVPIWTGTQEEYARDKDTIAPGTIVNITDDFSTLTTTQIANNQVTTEEGYALDARQANASIDGTLANQVSMLKESLSIKSVTYTNQTSNANGTIYTSLSADKKVIYMISTKGFCIPAKFSDVWCCALCNNAGDEFKTLPNTTSNITVVYFD